MTKRLTVTQWLRELPKEERATRIQLAVRAAPKLAPDVVDTLWEDFKARVTALGLDRAEFNGFVMGLEAKIQQDVAESLAAYFEETQR